MLISCSDSMQVLCQFFKKGRLKRLSVFQTTFRFQDLKKRIVPFFMPDVGHSAVSGDDARVFGQDKQFGADIMDEVGVVAAREVGSAYGFVKQYVACNK